MHVYVMAIAVAAASGLLLRIVLQRRRDSREATLPSGGIPINDVERDAVWDAPYGDIQSSVEAVRMIAVELCPDVQVSARNPTYRSLGAGFSLTVTTDIEKEALKEPDLVLKFRNAIRMSGYPAELVPLVGFSIQSQETIDRDYQGKWINWSM